MYKQKSSKIKNTQRKSFLTKEIFKFTRIYTVLVISCWPWGLSTSMVYIPSEGPFGKNNFPLCVVIKLG